MKKIIILTFYALLASSVAYAQPPPTSIGKVRIDPISKRIQVKDLNNQYQDFIIKGINYGGLPVGVTYINNNLGQCLNVGGTTQQTMNFICGQAGQPWNIYEFPFVVETDFQLIARPYLSANTVNIYVNIYNNPYPPNLASLLASAAKYDLKIFITYFVDGYLDFTSFTGSSGQLARTNFINTFSNFVRNLRNDPNYGQVLAINIGTENDLQFCSNPNIPSCNKDAQAAAFYPLINDSAKAAIGSGLNFDPKYRPIFTTSGNLLDWPTPPTPRYIGSSQHNADDTSLTHIQGHRFNLFLGNTFSSFMCNYKTRSTKPLLIEFGTDSFASNPTSFNCQTGNISGVTGSETSVSLATQATWAGLLWDEINTDYNNQGPACPVSLPSANVAKGGFWAMYADGWSKGRTAACGTSFPWCADVSTHDPQGWCNYAFPDNFANEEYWGVFSRSPTLGVYTPKPAAFTLRGKWY